MPEFSVILAWAGAIVGAYVLFFWVLAWWARRTPNDIDDVVVGVLQWPVMVFLFLTAVIALTNRSALTDAVKDPVTSAANILRIGVVTWAVWRLTRDTILYYGRRLAQRSEASFDDVLIPVLDVLAPVVIVGVAAILMLRLLGADISTVVLTTGGAAVVVGLALRDTLGNILGGLVLLIDTPFRFGDLIVWDGVVCQIKRIGLRVTTLYSTADHSDVYVPNSVLSSSKLANLTRPSPDLRVSIPVKVPDGLDTGRARALLYELADANPYVLGDLPRKLASMKKALESLDPASDAARQLKWGLSALRRERQLDTRLARITALLDRLLAIIRSAEKGGLSAEERALIAGELATLDDYDEQVKKGMRLWAQARTRDPQLRRFPEDRERLLSDAESRVHALEHHLEDLRDHLHSPNLYEMQRLDDMVVEFRDWLPVLFKTVTPAWKHPFVGLPEGGACDMTLYLTVYVDDIHLEGFLRRPRVITALSEAATAHLWEASTTLSTAA